MDMPLYPLMIAVFMGLLEADSHHVLMQDRFVFPMHLDMHPYTVEGLAAR